eukprot:symbB.v1.2.040858.t1/scaffold7600.1/size10347/1
MRISWKVGIPVFDAAGVFHQELLECPSGRPLVIDPLSCRSSKVLDTVLTFIYSSQISCDYSEDGCELWQLLCFSARYRLPEPLWRYARCALLQAIRNSAFSAVIPLLLEAVRWARHEIALSESEAYYISYVYLRNQVAETHREPSRKSTEAGMTKV